MVFFSWKRFRGGLDVKSDQTGTESIYEQFQNHEVMFHVSTLLPHSKSERQQLERKRHIGNDIVAIVFQETDTTFMPECITSQFLHVYLVVTPLDDQGTQYKVTVVHRDSVPSFGPPISHSKTFQCDHSFKNWILTKLINAEMASCRASTFQKYQVRTQSNRRRTVSRLLPSRLGTNENDFVRKFVSNFTRQQPTVDEFYRSSQSVSA